MDVPFAIQTYLLQDTGVRAALANSSYVFLLELPESMDPIMPTRCTVVDGVGGGAQFSAGTLELADQRISMRSYGENMHLAWNLDSAIYTALKGLVPSVWAHTYLHWVKPEISAYALRDPLTQYPYVLSTWQTLASDLTIAA